MPDLKPFAESSAEHLRLVLDTGQIGIWELDLQSGRAARNARHDEIFGYTEPLDEWTYEMFLDHVAPEDRRMVDERQKSAVAEDRTWEFECRIRRPDGTVRWISAAGRPLKDPDGRPQKLIGHVIDISLSKEREARLALLADELNHRVRNMLAMIGSMIRMTIDRASDIRSFAESLEGRVGALARSHRLLVSESSARMTPSAILETELAAFPALRERTRIDSTGESILPGEAGQGLALIFHELITNAIKYGAFSADAGRVEVRIRDKGGAVRIDWKETGGPEVGPPQATGFGSVLISQAMGGRGRVEVSYPTDGLACAIVIEAR